MKKYALSAVPLLALIACPPPSPQVTPAPVVTPVVENTFGCTDPLPRGIGRIALENKNGTYPLDSTLLSQVENPHDLNPDGTQKFPPSDNYCAKSLSFNEDGITGRTECPMRPECDPSVDYCPFTDRSNCESYALNKFGGKDELNWQASPGCTVTPDPNNRWRAKYEGTCSWVRLCTFNHKYCSPVLHF